MRRAGEDRMRWNCETDGCFNVKRRPKFQAFTDVFPRRIGMSDVDGVVEINGQFLFMEWKKPGVLVPTGQKIMFKNLTARLPATVFVVNGDAEKMQVVSYQVWRNGNPHPEQIANLADLRERFRAWAMWADTARAA